MKFTIEQHGGAFFLRDEIGRYDTHQYFGPRPYLTERAAVDRAWERAITAGVPTAEVTLPGASLSLEG